jgi:hypothetical protein
LDIIRRVEHLAVINDCIGGFDVLAASGFAKFASMGKSPAAVTGMSY